MYNKFYKKFLIFVIGSLITYSLYFYPFDSLLYLIYDQSFFKLSSLTLSIFFYIFLIYYFKSKYNLFFIKFLVYEGLGIGFISFTIINFVLILNLFTNISNPLLGKLSLVLIFLLSLWSLINGRLISLREIIVKSKKLKNNVKITFISDVHLGSNSKKHLEKIIHKVKDLNSDIILIGGDLIDSSKFDINHLKLFEQIKIPIFFTSGNHELYLENYSQIKKKIRSLKFKIFEQNSLYYKDINFLGIGDEFNINKQKLILNKLIKKNVFNLLFIHKPEIWKVAKDKVDLMLCGHTHRGQIFPFSFIVKLKHKYIYGIYENFSSKLFVSSGAGCWGPKMRLGSKNEIVQISLTKS